MLYANPDGSNAQNLFGGQLALALESPAFSPDGQMAVISGSSYTATSQASRQYQFRIATIGGGVKMVDGAYYTWRTDSAAMAIMVFTSESAPPVPELYDLRSGVTTPMEAGSSFYLWGN